MVKLSRLSTPRSDNVKCIKVFPSGLEVIIFIFFGSNHLILHLQVFSIISGELTTTLTLKHKIRVIHVRDDPFNYFCTGDDEDAACNPMHPRLLDIDVCVHIF